MLDLKPVFPWKHVAASSSALQPACKTGVVSSSASEQELLRVTQQEAARLVIGPRSPVPGATSMLRVTQTERKPGPCALSVAWCCCWRELEEMPWRCVPGGISGCESPVAGEP